MSNLDRATNDLRQASKLASEQIKENWDVLRALCAPVSEGGMKEIEKRLQAALAAVGASEIMEESRVKKTIQEALQLLGDNDSHPEVLAAKAILTDALGRDDDVAGTMAFFARDALFSLSDEDDYFEVYYLLDKIHG